MTITAKLSRRFYEQFGDQVVDELVNLLNNVDENSRSNLKDLNEQNFARFEAKLDQRIGQLGAELRVEMHALRSDMIKWMFIFFTGSALANILLK